MEDCSIYNSKVLHSKHIVEVKIPDFNKIAKLILFFKIIYLSLSKFCILL